MAKAASSDENLEIRKPTTSLNALLTWPAYRLADFSNISFRAWALIFLVSVVGVGAISAVLWGPGMDFPAAWGRDIGGTIDRAVKWLTTNGDWLFDGIKQIVLQLLVWLEDALLWVPWPAVVVAVGMIAWRVSGPALALFCGAALLVTGLMGRLPGNSDTLWESSMETLTLILVSVAISLVMGIPLGVLAAGNRWLNNISRPVLDGAQTMPSFVYLVPALLFFGLGAVPAVMATVIYAIPPVIRLTNLGIRQVSPQTVEAARSFGATPIQLLIKVQIPMALPTIMAGVNQTTMLALSMVVAASLVGAGGLGEVVLRGLQRQETGNAFIGGMAIICIAVIIDRITQALAKSREQALSGGH